MPESEAGKHKTEATGEHVWGDATIQGVILIGCEPRFWPLIRDLARKWRLILVDLGLRWEELRPFHEEMIRQQKHLWIRKDASSRLTWKDVPWRSVRAVVSTLSDPQVNLEVLHQIRDHYQICTPFMILGDDGSSSDHDVLREQTDVSYVSPLALAREVLLTRLATRTAYAVNIGLGKGELVEVTVNARSHLVDRKLRFLRPKEWHIAAIYRQGSLLLPTGNLAVQVGDRVVLAGDPRVLEGVASTLRQGEPQFPQPYGSQMALPLHHRWLGILDEGQYWKNHCPIGSVMGFPWKGGMGSVVVERVRERFSSLASGPVLGSWKEWSEVITPETGLSLMPKKPGRWGGLLPFSRIRMLNHPVLLARGMGGYQSILVALDGPDPTLALNTGLELSRLFKIPMEAFASRTPEGLSGMGQGRELVNKERLIRDLATIHDIHIPWNVFEGNPVLGPGAWLADKKDSLLVVSHRNRRGGFLWGAPSLTRGLARRFPGSVLLVPSQETMES